MGATYMKMGQYLALRRDLLPPAIADELDNLFEAVPPMPARDVRRVVEAELGGRLEDHFPRFDWTPIGAGSIAQVHRAVDRQGRNLAVKVQRRRVARLLRADLNNLVRVARLADLFRLTGVISLRAIVEEVAEFTLRELDFEVEGLTADRLRADVPPGVRVPLIYWELTTPRVLAIEFIEGVSLLKFCQAAERGDEAEIARVLGGADLEALIDRLAKACLVQIFVAGFFHGDPHPANVLIGIGGEIVFIDFGIFGEVDADLRENLSEYLEKLSIGDLDGAYRRYLRMVNPTDEADLHGFRREALATHAQWRDASVDPQNSPESERLIAYHQGRLFDVLRRYRIRVPPDQLLLWRALAVLDATSHRLPIRFDLLSALRRFFAETRPSPAVRLRRLMARSLAPSAGPRAVEAASLAGRAAARGLARPVAAIEAHAAPAGRRASTRRVLLPAAAVLLTACAVLGAHP